jgi:hypothetical protein
MNVELGNGKEIDIVVHQAVALSAVLIFTTIQTQDFPDVEGDLAVGRVTLPIYAPEASRIGTLLSLLAWSVILTRFWGIGLALSAILCLLGGCIGIRLYVWRTAKSDRISYRIFNVRACLFLKSCSVF